MSNNKPSPALHRKLKARHMSMIAIGGAIGTGIFLASGVSIHNAGPGGALLAYGLVGIMVYFLMTSLGEMAALLPTSGSFYTYAERFVEPSLGYAMGINYWYNWAITLAAELAAAAMIVKFWFPGASATEWSAAFLVLIFLLNAFSVKGFGEAEYWMSWIKVATIIVFIIFGALTIFGVIGHHGPVGFKNWQIAGGPFHGGILAIVGVFMVAGFAFQGTELIGVTAGESENPAKNIPMAIKKVFWRILLFYILAMLVISFLIPYTSPLLLKDNVAMSPFTLVFTQAGIHQAASFMNFVILVAVISAGNSGTYASTRMLHYLAKKRHVPKIFAKTTKRGVPFYSLLATSLVGMMAFLASKYGDGTVYLWLLNASGLSGFITWLGIAVSHYRFRKAYVLQGRDLSKLPYLAKMFPFGPLFAFGLCAIIVIGQNYGAFMGSHINWHGIVVSYIGLPVFLLIWLVHKFVTKAKLIPLKDCRFDMQGEE